MDKNLYVYDSGNNRQVRLTGDSNGQLSVDVKNTSLTVDASGTTLDVQSNSKNLVSETTVTGMRDASINSVHSGTVGTTEYTSSLACDKYSMCALYMSSSLLTATVHLQYSPDNTNWFTIHSETFTNESENRVTIRDLTAANCRLLIDADGANAGSLTAHIVLNRQ